MHTDKKHRKRQPNPNQRLLQTKKNLSRRLLISDAINLDATINHHRRNNTSPCRRILAKILPKHLIERSKVTRIIEPHTATNDLLRPIPSFPPNPENIPNRFV